MAQMIAGTACLNVNTQWMAVRGRFTVSPSAVERARLAGQDGVHGFQELPRVPWIEADLSTVPEMSLEALEAETDVTVVAQLANCIQYTLYGATCKAGFEANTRDGQVRVRWEGLACEEIKL